MRHSLLPYFLLVTATFAQAPRVVTKIDAMKAPAGRTHIESQSKLRFKESADKTDFVAYLGFGESGGLPEQTGHDGKILTTDGSDASWTDTLGGFNFNGIVVLQDGAAIGIDAGVASGSISDIDSDGNFVIANGDTSKKINITTGTFTGAWNLGTPSALELNNVGMNDLTITAADAGVIITGTSVTIAPMGTGVMDSVIIGGTGPEEGTFTVLAATDGSGVAALDADNLASGTVANARLDADLQTFAAITPSANVQTMLGSANNAAILSNIGAQAAFTDSAGLRSALSDESGTGVAVFQGGNVGVATATSFAVNGATIGAHALAVIGTINSFTDANNNFTLSTAGSGSNLTASRGIGLTAGSGWGINLQASGGIILGTTSIAMGGNEGQSNNVTTKTGSVTAFTDATPKRACRITVPNGAHSGMLRVTLVGSIGAGGSIGANEATRTIAYDIGIARTSGVAMNAAISTAYGNSGSVAVAGATTIDVTAAITLNAEGAGVSNTADVMVTITKGGGTSANHTCRVVAEVVNVNNNGITISIP